MELAVIIIVRNGVTLFYSVTDDGRYYWNAKDTHAIGFNTTEDADNFGHSRFTQCTDWKSGYHTFKV